MEMEIPSLKKNCRKKVSKSLRRQIWEQSFGKAGEALCVGCSVAKLSPFDFDVAHLVPVSKGGETIPNNLIPLCRLCNSSFNTKMLSRQQFNLSNVSNTDGAKFNFIIKLPPVKVCLSNENLSVASLYEQLIANISVLLKGSQLHSTESPITSDTEFQQCVQKNKSKKSLLLQVNGCEKGHHKRKRTDILTTYSDVQCQEKIDGLPNSAFIEYVLTVNQEQKLNKKLTASFLKTFLPAIESKETFATSLEDLALWLGTTQENMRRLISRNSQSYKEGVDFVIREKYGQRRSGRRQQNVLLSTDCFKRLALQSQAPNAEQVRTYFILMETMHREFIQNMKRKNDELISNEVTNVSH